jgi:N-acetylglucosamine-6-phosphate deacetylase
LLTPDEELSPGILTVRDGMLAAVRAEQAPPGAIALAGTVVPGLVDLQMNGWASNGVLGATPEQIEAIGRDMLSVGVTAWAPTIVSAPEHTRLETLDAVAAARGAAGTARIVGAHLEGPWISAVRGGAHDRAVLADPDPDVVGRSLSRHDGLVRIVTVAPELSGALDAVRQVTDAGAIASIGHTDATLEETTAAIDAGARMATHLFNAMRPLHQREPGVIGAILSDERVVAGLIADGTHVHPTLVAIAFRTKPGRIALVSDAVPGHGGGAAQLPDGTLAGSLTPLCAGVRVAAAAGVELAAALRAATSTPATLVGEPYGRLIPGAPADFVVLDDDLRPTATYLAGELAWSS